MALDELMQTIEGRVRILELGEKLHYDLNAVFVGTIDFEGLNYYYWPPETEIKKVTEVYKALAKTGVRISSVPIEKLSQDPARYNARFGRADLVITKKDQVRNIHSGNIVERIPQNRVKHEIFSRTAFCPRPKSVENNNGKQNHDLHYWKRHESA